MMKGLAFAVAVIAALLCWLPVRAQESSVTLTELQSLKAENFALRRQLVVNQCETFLKQSDAERLTLEQAFRAELKVDPALIFNWQTKQFEPKSEEKK